MKSHEKLGPIARQLCWLFDAWIVGGAVRYLAYPHDTTIEKPKDIDIVIPIDRWVEASKLIPQKAVANRFGGFKFVDGEFDIDVWCDDVARLFLSNDENFKAYQPKYNIGIIKI